MNKTTLAEQLNAAQLAVNNTLADAEIKAAVASFGYTDVRLNEGKALCTAALQALNAKTAKAGSQLASTAELNQKRKAAEAAYQDLAQVARAIFGKERVRLNALGLRGTMPKSTDAFIASAYTLFDNTLTVPELKTSLASYGYSEAKLNSERAKIAAYDTANQTQESAKGGARQSTREQETAIKSLNDWTTQYIKIAKVALRTKPQLLEKLGVPVRTTKTEAQRNASKKAAETRKNRKQSK